MSGVASVPCQTNLTKYIIAASGHWIKRHPVLCVGFPRVSSCPQQVNFAALSQAVRACIMDKQRDTVTHTKRIRENSQKTIERKMTWSTRTISTPVSLCIDWYWTRCTQPATKELLRTVLNRQLTTTHTNTFYRVANKITSTTFSLERAHLVSLRITALVTGWNSCL